MKYATVKKRENIYKLGLKDEDGNVFRDKQGKEIYWQFNLDDIQLPLKYNKCYNEINQCRNKLKITFSSIDKNKNGNCRRRGLLTENESKKIEALNEFYSKAIKAMNLFLGENGVDKYLNGSDPYWEMFDDINDTLKPFLDEMNISVNNMIDKIKDKYSKRDNGKVIKNEH